MLFLQMTGLSGAGKSTISSLVKEELEPEFPVAIIDGDAYRQTVCKDLGYTREDRMENIRRLGRIAFDFFNQKNIVLLSAINPYECIRQELQQLYGCRTVYVECELNTVILRDTKGFYRRALLPDDHPEKIRQFTGVNDPYEIPLHPDLTLSTHLEPPALSAQKLCRYIHLCIQSTLPQHIH